MTQALSSSRKTISVVISSYNYARYVGNTIQSVLDQTRLPDEIIVVDDGSPDDSLEIIEAFRDRVRIVAKDNGGQASALNAGFAASSGEIILFLDSDDRLLPQCIERVEKAWTENLSKIHFTLQIIDGNGRECKGTRPPGTLPSGDLVPVILAHGGYKTSPTSGNVFSRRALAHVMPIPEQEWRTYADCPLLFITPFFGKVGAINEILGQYRVHAGNASGLIRDGQVQLRAVRSEIVRDMRQAALVKEFCDQNGHQFEAGTLLRNWYSIKLRLVSRRLAPEAHPFAGERRLSLLAAGLRELWTCKQLAFRERLLFSGWTVAMALGPNTLAPRLARVAYTRPNSGGFG